MAQAIIRPVLVRLATYAPRACIQPALLLHAQAALQDMSRESRVGIIVGSVVEAIIQLALLQVAQHARQVSIQEALCPPAQAAWLVLTREVLAKQVAFCAQEAKVKAFQVNRVV